jgi:hypothetical protein
MFSVPRWLLTVVATSFALFHAVLGAVAWRGYDNVFYLALSIAIYLVSMAIAVSFREGLTMGPLIGSISGVGAVATSLIANLGIGDGQTGTYASWYVGGMGVLLGVVAIRGEATLAWFSAILVSVIVIQAGGFAAFGNAGVVGMVVLIAAGQGTARALARTDREIEVLQRDSISAQDSIARSEAAGLERKSRLQNVLTRALPALSYISTTHGELTEEQKLRAMQLEAALRDEIRGRKLVNETVKLATASARERGVQVVLMDEGGLDDSSEESRELILAKVAKAIDSVASGKVVVRSPKGESWLLTVTATRPGTNAPDLWLKF